MEESATRYREQVAAETRRDELRHISKILQNRGVVWLAEWLKAELATLPASGQAEAKETKQ
jgi:hypothetical protein